MTLPLFCCVCDIRHRRLECFVCCGYSNCCCRMLLMNCRDNVVVVDITASFATPTALVTSPAYSLTTLLGTIQLTRTLQ